MASSPAHNDDFDFEPIPGLPEALPEGEALLWQGRPDEVRLGREAFRMHWIGVYFAILALWQVATAFHDLPTTAEAWRVALGGVLRTAVLAFATLGLLSFLGRRMARGTIYSITSKRVVIRSGLAMPMAINLPYSRIDGAGLKLNADGSGDIPLKLAPGKKLAFVTLWPNVRPWKLFRAEPMLRSIPDAQKVASLLAEAISSTASEPTKIPVRVLLPNAAPRPRAVPQANPTSSGIAVAS
jgi:hypothetical protein